MRLLKGVGNIMKIDVKIFTLAATIGILVCIIDRVLANVPRQEVYIKLVIMAGFLTLGFIAARIIIQGREAEEGLLAVNQQLSASNMHLQSAEQQLRASNQQLKANNQQLQAAQQQLGAANKQLQASNQQLRTAEQELLTLTNRQEAILASAPDIIMEVDNNKVYTWANQAGYEFFGPEVLGKDAAYYFEGEQKTYDLVQPLFAGDEDIFYMESRQRRQDGEKRLLAWWCRVRKDNRGNVTGALSTARDITQQKQAEEALQAANQQLEAAEQQLRAANQQLQAGNQQLRAQQAELKQLNHDLGERVKELNCLYGLTKLAQQREVSLENICRKLPELMRRGWQYPEATGVRVVLGGQEFTTDNFRQTQWLQAAKVGAEDKKIGRLEVYYLKEQPEADEGPFLKYERDLIDALAENLGKIVERRRAVEALWRERDNLVNVFNAMEDGMYIVDQQYNIQYVNRVLEGDFGKWVGRKCYEYFHDRREVCPWCKNQEVFAGNTVRWEWRSKKNNKTYDLVDTPLCNPDGSISKLEIFRDITARKQAQEALRQSERRFQQVAENAQEWIWEVDAAGLYTYVSPVVSKILGYQPEELVGKKHFYDLFHPEDQEELKKAALEAFARKLSFREFENRNVHKNGQTVWLSTSGIALLDENGELLGYRGADTDITERKQAEEALRESAATARALLNAPDDVAALADEKGYILDINEAMAQRFGKDVQELIGTYGWDLLPPDIGEQRKSYFNEVIESGAPVRFEDQHQGTWFDNIFYPVIDAKGKVARVAILARDITERKRAEEALQESERRYRNIFENAVIGMYRTTPDGRILMANPTLLRMLGYSSFEELARRNLEEKGFETQYPRAAFKEQIESQGQVQGLESAWIKSDGATLFIRENAVAVRDQEGKTLYYEGSVEDITRRKQSEQKLRENEQRYRTIFDGSRDAIFIAAEDAKFVQVNEAAVALTGYSREELLKMTIPQLHEEEDAEAFKQYFHRIMAGEQITSEARILRRDGAKIDTEFSNNRFTIGDAAYMHTVARDITARKLAQVELQKRSLYLRIHKTAAVAANEAKSAEEAFQAVLDEICNHTGWPSGTVLVKSKDSPEELESTDLWHLEDPERLEPMRKSFETYRHKKGVGLAGDVFASGQALWINSKQFSNDETHYLHGKLANSLGIKTSFGFPVKIGDEVVAVLLFGATDVKAPDQVFLDVMADIGTQLGRVVERKRSEEALRESAATARALLNAPDDVAVLADEKGYILDINEAMAQRFGKDVQELIGTYGWDLLPPDIGEQRKSYFNEVIESGAPVRFEDQHQGTWFDNIFYPVIDAKGKVTRVAILARDITERKQAEEAIKKSEEKFAKAFHATSNLMGISTFKEGRIIDINQAYCRIVGYDRQELIGHTTAEFNIWADPQQRDIVVRKLKEEGRVYDFEVGIRTKSGDIRTVLFSADTIILNDEPCLINMAIDITERIQVEQDLRESEARYKRLVENSPDIIWSFSDKHGTLYASARANEILGYPPEFLCQNPWLWNQSIHPDDRDLVGRAIADFAADRPVDMEYRIKDSAGNWRWFHDRSIGRRQQDDETIMEGISADITERKGIEQTLQEYEKAVEGSQDMVAVVDRNYTYQLANQSFLRARSMTREQVVGHAASEVLGPEVFEKIVKPRLDRCFEGESVQFEMSYQYPQLGERILDVSYYPIKTEKNQIDRVIALIRDITDFKRAESQAQQRRQELAHAARLSSVGEMASGLAHELNQPLAAISAFAGGCLRMLESGATASEEILAAMQNVAAQAHRAGEIIRRIRDFTRKQEPKRSDIDINHIVREAINFIKPQADQKHIDLKLELAEQLPFILADAVQIEQVVLNLLRNGLEALEEPDLEQRRLTIQTGWKDDKNAVEVTISDTGAGFPAPDAEKLFDSFFTTKSQGLGIGLSLSRSIIESHGGHLRAQVNPASGAVFRFTLPAQAP